MKPANPRYFRGDQRNGITAPDLTKDCEYADHIVKARGKRTKYTSLSLDRGCIEKFGEVHYELLRDMTEEQGHRVVDHDNLMKSLTSVAQSGEKAERLKAIRALSYARCRKEGLVDWQFDIKNVVRKDLITWAFEAVQMFFRRI